MKKLINHPDKFVDEMLDGILTAFPDKYKTVEGYPRALVRADSVKDGKVGIVTGGGSGHLPTFLGFVGQGMLDGCGVGNVFASPSANTLFQCVKAADKGNGVLCLYGNYGGDIMNFEMACEMADTEDIACRQVLVKDDVASTPESEAQKRRGVAGLGFAYKIAGAAADSMMSLDEVTAVTERALENIRSIGVATSPCILPQVGKPTFTIGENEIEIGMGIHGEPGIETRALMQADELAELLFNKVNTELKLAKGDKAVVMLNGLGGTPMEELFIMYRKIAALLGKIGVALEKPLIGEFATSMEMAGMSLTIFKLADAELEKLYKYPAATPFFTNHNLI